MPCTSGTPTDCNLARKSAVSRRTNQSLRCVSTCLAVAPRIIVFQDVYDTSSMILQLSDQLPSHLYVARNLACAFPWAHSKSLAKSPAHVPFHSGCAYCSAMRARRTLGP